MTKALKWKIIWSMFYAADRWSLYCMAFSDDKMRVHYNKDADMLTIYGATPHDNSECYQFKQLTFDDLVDLKLEDIKNGD